MIPDETGQTWLTSANHFDLPLSTELFALTKVSTGHLYQIDLTQPQQHLQVQIRYLPQTLGRFWGRLWASFLPSYFFISVVVYLNRCRSARGSKTYGILLKERNLWKKSSIQLSDLRPLGESRTETRIGASWIGRCRIEEFFEFQFSVSLHQVSLIVGEMGTRLGQ
jgi:hypothetical protein